jgi:hypothetical protein
VRAADISAEDSTQGVRAAIHNQVLLTEVITACHNTKHLHNLPKLRQHEAQEMK